MDEEAERATQAALEIGQACGQPDAYLFFTAQMYCLRREQGRVAELEKTLREAAERWPGFPFLRVCLAHACCEQGRDADARAIFDPLAGLPFDLTWTIGMSACTEVAVHLGDTASAGAL